MTPNALDHLLVVILIAAVPLHGAWEYRRLVRDVRAGEPDARARQYRKTMIVEWAATAGVVAFWLSMDRAVADLGFAVPGGLRLLLGAAITAVGLAFLYGQWRAAAKLDDEGMRSLRAQMESVAELLPRTPREASLFRALSVTAGVCEEIVYRGYLIWYLASFTGAWLAAVLAGVVFGLVHIYQGRSGAIRTGLVGLFAALLYVATDSLLWPMILHAAIDLQGGALANRVLASGKPTAIDRDRTSASTP